jgi:hypothetical protein
MSTFEHVFTAKQYPSNKNFLATDGDNMADIDLNSSVSSYYTAESFIKNSLSLVQIDNMFNQPTKRTLLFQIYYTSLQYVAGFIKDRLTIRSIELLENKNLASNWYLMPSDFAGWVNISPLFYTFDKFGNWSFKFASTTDQRAATYSQDETTYLRYHAVPDLNGVDCDFIMMLRWHFLRELALCQNSVAQFSQIIELRYNEYKSIFATHAKKNNTRLSAGHNIRSVTNVGTL